MAQLMRYVLCVLVFCLCALCGLNISEDLEV